MNDYNLLMFIEELLALYTERKITVHAAAYTREFKSLVGQMQDAVANTE